MTPEEREARIDRYQDGPRKLREALGLVPDEARKWRPGEGKWSVHEVICHCADSEANAYGRIRYVVAEEDPLIPGYDQDRWAVALDYHQQPLELALAVIDAVRASTSALLRRLPAGAWQRKARHSESGAYGAERWLELYSEHLEIHTGQIQRLHQAWRDASLAGGASEPGWAHR